MNIKGHLTDRPGNEMCQRVYILLPVHNRRELTQKFMCSLKNQVYQNFHLILIDDGSTDGTEKMVRSLIEPEKLTVITGRGRWWWAGGLQKGINRLKRFPPSQDDIVLMINDDVTFNRDFIKNGVGMLSKMPDTLLLARDFDESNGMSIETGVHAEFKHLSFVTVDSPEDINCLSTRGLFMRWNVLERVGGFYPFLLPHYGSDYEFTMRAMRKGISLRTDASVYLISNSSTTGFKVMPEGASLYDVVKLLFTKKSGMNPLYWTSFILLTSPAKYIPKNIIIVWLRAGREIFKSIRGAIVGKRRAI